jgi:hypothetical protein
VIERVGQGLVLKHLVAQQGHLGLLDLLLEVPHGGVDHPHEVMRLQLESCLVHRPSPQPAFASETPSKSDCGNSGNTWPKSPRTLSAMRT